MAEEQMKQYVNTLVTEFVTGLKKVKELRPSTKIFLPSLLQNDHLEIGGGTRLINLFSKVLIQMKYPKTSLIFFNSSEVIIKFDKDEFTKWFQKATDEKLKEMEEEEDSPPALKEAKKEEKKKDIEFIMGSTGRIIVNTNIGYDWTKAQHQDEFQKWMKKYFPYGEWNLLRPMLSPPYGVNLEIHNFNTNIV